MLMLVTGLLLFAAAGWLWVRPRTIEITQADAIAKQVAVRFAAVSGQPVAHFGRARRITWPDGWEYVWSYKPCPDEASLRVFVPVAGRRIRITQAPDCEAGTGFGVKPVRV
jgi:hypothetical protein